MTLRFKIYTVVAAVAIVAYLILWTLLAHAERTERVASAEFIAREMVANADVTDSYIRKEVSPLLTHIGGGNLVFIPQSAGFYAVETEGRLIGQSLPGYRLRRVVLDSTGPADTPDAWERDAIMRLRGAGGGASFSEVRPGVGVSYVAPVRMREGACATCYPSLDSAPMGVRDAFGAAHGFGRHPGEIVGATIATVPLPPPTPFFASLRFLAALVVLALALILCLLVELFVLRPLSRIAVVAERISMGAEGVEEFDTRRPGELGALAMSFNRLRRSMESAMALVDS
ncbi:c-type heme family protein [Acidomonas methanolica]|uniref:c-type heme family protein n=1 Tax=Acidomonas methanolica TaxID=437 RepID=UPI00211A66DD|nr:DUF3365 domain-containing protein [Acidomonas methanolica]MCQ9154986.1 DUF3365 domain-containing protein [Acidomonas methanolica]